MQNKKQTQIIVVLLAILAMVAFIYLNNHTKAAQQALQQSQQDQANAYGSQASTTTSTTPTTDTTSTNPQTMNTITLVTNKGTIVFETFNSDAPKAVGNFITLAQKGFYNNLTFHRVIKGFMIQGGDPTGNGSGGPGYQFADELNPNTDSYKLGYQKGIVAMANAGPNTNGSQFFIMLADTPLPHAYTIFGKVISGQDVVDAIGSVQTGANDKPVSPVVIKSVTVK